MSAHDRYWWQQSPMAYRKETMPTEHDARLENAYTETPATPPQRVTFLVTFECENTESAVPEPEEIENQLAILHGVLQVHAIQWTTPPKSL